jgi:ribosome-binding factor A
METTRQNKISRLIQKELSDIFQRQTQALHGVLVSVSAVRISPDMSVCRGYLSIFPSERGQEILNNINAQQASVRYELGKRLRYQLRIIPEINFFLDDSLDYIEHIDELLKGTAASSTDDKAASSTDEKATTQQPSNSDEAK